MNWLANETPRLPGRGDIWGGLAAMFVALPAAIAFGVTVYGAIGPAFAGQGAVAGIVGATLIGLLASTLGGAPRLISAPCAPAAAVLSAFAIDMVKRGDDPGVIVLLLTIVGLLAGLIQVLLGLVGVGRLIKYIPYPVVSGYMTAVGLIIIGSQIPHFLGMPDGAAWWPSLISPGGWDWRAIGVGMVTVIVSIGASHWTERVPGTILGLLAGITTYFAFAAGDATLLSTAGNTLIIGSAIAPGTGFADSLASRWDGISRMSSAHLAGLLGSAVTLAALLSIDTLKTCVVLDKLTRSRHASDRELMAQGVANIASSACGGISGAGTMGATLVGLNSGIESRWGGIAEGAFALVAGLLLGSLITWIPVAALAGILMVVGVRMIDREPLRYLRTRARILDFMVVLAVIVVAITVGLIAASAVGVGLAMVLFVREQIGGVVVRNKMDLGDTSSTWHRPERELGILSGMESTAIIFELQGPLFFGNTYQLYGDIEQEIPSHRFVIIDLRRVQSIDVTAAQLFSQIRDSIRARGAVLLLSGVHTSRRKGSNLLEQLDFGGSAEDGVRILPDLDSAIAWVEDSLIGENQAALDAEAPMRLQEMELFAHHKDETLSALEASMQLRHCRAGEVIYPSGSAGDELYWVRKGSVRLMATIGKKGSRQVAGFGRGDFFGGLAFLDNGPRPHDAIAIVETELYVLSRENFEQVAREHKRLAYNLMSAMAHTLAMRLRRAEKNLAVLRD